MNDLKEVASESAKGISVLTVAVGLAMAIDGIGSIMVTRILGPIHYADYSLSLVLPSLLFGFSIFGIDTAINRFIPKLMAEKKFKEAETVLRAGLVSRIVIGGILMAGGILVSNFFASMLLGASKLGSYSRFACIAVIFEAIYWFGYYASQGLNHMVTSGGIRLVQATTKTTLSTILVLQGMEVLGALIGFVVSYLVAGFAALVSLHWQTGDSSNSKEIGFPKNMRKLFRYGFPLYLITMIFVFSTQYRLIIASIFSTDLEVGNFSAATNLAALLRGITISFIWALIPTFSRISATTSERERNLVFKYAHRYVSMLIVPITLFMIIAAPEITLLLYGAEYSLAPVYLRLICCIYLLVALGYAVLETFFNGVGQNRLSLELWVVFIVVFIPLGYIAAAVLGVLGAIAAEFLSAFISCLFALYRSKRKINIEIDYSGICRVLLASLLAAGITTLLLPYFSSVFFRLILGFLLFLFLYITILPLVNGIIPLDLRILEKAFVPIKVVGSIVNAFLKYEGILIGDNED